MLFLIPVTFLQFWIVLWYLDVRRFNLQLSLCWQSARLIKSLKSHRWLRLRLTLNLFTDRCCSRFLIGLVILLIVINLFQVEFWYPWYWFFSLFRLFNWLNLFSYKLFVLAKFRYWWCAPHNIVLGQYFWFVDWSCYVIFYSRFLRCPKNWLDCTSLCWCQVFDAVELFIYVNFA